MKCKLLNVVGKNEGKIFYISSKLNYLCGMLKLLNGINVYEKIKYKKMQLKLKI